MSPAPSGRPNPSRALYLTHPPRWHPAKCGTVPTKLWQYAEQGACNLVANVDLNVGGPGFVTANFCFHLSRRP
jgi:hypothetical protein